MTTTYTGMKFGKLTTLSDVGKATQAHNRIWLFACECAEVIERPISNVRAVIRRGGVQSCPSCLVRVAHIAYKMQGSFA